MTFIEFCEKYNLKQLSKGEDKVIEGGFAGDLHSWAMANAHENYAWFTIMGNINTVAEKRKATLGRRRNLENLPVYLNQCLYQAIY